MSQQFKQEISADVQAKLGERVSRLKSGKMGSVVVPAVVLAFVPQAVQIGVDMVVQAIGKPIESLAQADKSHIRDFVSNSTLQYLDSLIRGLEDAPDTQ